MDDFERMVMDAISEEAVKEGLKCLLQNNVSQDTSGRWSSAIEYKEDGSEGTSRTIRCAPRVPSPIPLPSNYTCRACRLHYSFHNLPGPLKPTKTSSHKRILS